MLSRRKTNVKIKGSNRKVEIVKKRVDLNVEKNKCKMLIAKNILDVAITRLRHKKCIRCAVIRSSDYEAFARDEVARVVYSEMWRKDCHFAKNAFLLLILVLNISMQHHIKICFFCTKFTTLFRDLSQSNHFYASGHTQPIIARNRTHSTSAVRRSA